MTIRVSERPKQGGTIQFKGPKARREYVVSGTTVKLDAQIAVANAAPASEASVDTFGATINLFLNSIDIREVGGGVWEATCDYEDTADQFDLKFNIGTQTTRIFQSKQHIRSYDC